MRKFLPWEDFEIIAGQAAAFPKRIKKVLFSSIGEPLLNRNLPRMIARLRELGVADTYEVVSNGSMLTHELTRALVDAGLGRLCISVQGVTAEQYKAMCGYDIDLEAFVAELRYFYEYSRGKCKLHIKTVDAALTQPGDRETFYRMFSEICDTIYVDHVIDMFEGVDVSGLKQDGGHVFQDDVHAHVDVCAALFYTLYVAPNGEIVPCCKTPYPLHYGNIHSESLVDAWKGERRRAFLRLHLKKQRKQNFICRECVLPEATEFKEDLLDNAAASLLPKFDEKCRSR